MSNKNQSGLRSGEFIAGSSEEYIRLKQCIDEDTEKLFDGDRTLLADEIKNIVERGFQKIRTRQAAAELDSSN